MDYTIVKKSTGECVTPHESAAWSRVQGPILEPPPHLLIHEQKILELTHRITELLTGEVPINYQDGTVDFSMEESEYVEGHKDLDIVMIEDHRPLTSQDGVMDRNPPERCPRPLYSQDYPEGNVPENHQGGHLTIIKVEDEEERMTGNHPCLWEVKEKIPGDVNPEKPSGNSHRNVMLSMNYKGEGDDIMHHSSGATLLTFNVHQGLHSTDLSYKNPLDLNEPSCDQPQIVTTRSDQKLGERFQCNECGKEFTRRWSLFTHKRIHTGEKLYSCSECGKCFGSKSSLVTHKRIHTGEKPYSCSECAKCFRSKSDLIKHERSHTGEKPYLCTECGKCFASKSELVKHERRHTGDKPYSCSECGKCFTGKPSLVRHERSHTGEKPYSCSECGKDFIGKSELVIHERSHTGEKPYSCSQCGKCFITKGKLSNHQRSHTEENYVTVVINSPILQDNPE